MRQLPFEPDPSCPTCACSSTTTSRPRVTRLRAAASPSRPAPTMATSRTSVMMAHATATRCKHSRRSMRSVRFRCQLRRSDEIIAPNSGYGRSGPRPAARGGRKAGSCVVAEPVVGGWCDPAFGLLREEFAMNFSARAELGAAVCVSIRGAVVANLWGGWRDASRQRPWTGDTLVNVFSVGKGLLAACVARLTGQGLIDPDERVARYWPEFAAAGKADVTVRQLMSHQAG